MIPGSVPKALGKESAHGFMGKVKVDTSKTDEFHRRQPKGGAQECLRERLA